MDIREKLVELLDEAEDQYLEAVSGAESSEERYAIVKDAYGFYADHLLDSGVTVQEWIPVTERLPKKWQNVLVCRGGKEPYIEFVLSTGDWERDDISSIPVTHWMPLPQPPKGE